MRGLMIGMLAIVFACSFAFGDDDHAKTAHKATGADVYARAVDALTGEPLGDGPIKIVHEGRELRFATQANADAFAKDPAPALKKLDAEMIAEQMPSYALKTCPVSDEELGGMGKPVDVIVNNRLVRLCCAGCRGALRKDPKPAFEKINAAVIAAQKPGYPLKNCIVIEEDAIEDDAIDYVVANRLVRFCCDHCVGTFEKNPAKYLARLDAAKK